MTIQAQWFATAACAFAIHLYETGVTGFAGIVQAGRSLKETGTNHEMTIFMELMEVT